MIGSVAGVLSCNVFSHVDLFSMLQSFLPAFYLLYSDDGSRPSLLYSSYLLQVKSAYNMILLYGFRLRRRETCLIAKVRI